MFAILSPAKKLDFDTTLPPLPANTLPRFLEESSELIRIMRDKSPADIAKLMKVSDKIAHLNAERYAAWRDDMEPNAARACAFAFRGDTYKGLDVDNFTANELDAAQQQLRILSGLYGLLRPLDRIRPYRLEMGTRLATPQGKDLYQFWGDKLTKQLQEDMEEQGSNVLVDLASQEYAKVIKKRSLPCEVVTPRFEDEKNGNYKVISFYAKRARGMMAAWIVQEQATKAVDLQQFDVAGYRYSKAGSTQDQPIFRRAEKI